MAVVYTRRAPRLLGKNEGSIVDGVTSTASKSNATGPEEVDM
jgi:hypothetical protein